MLISSELEQTGAETVYGRGLILFGQKIFAKNSYVYFQKNLKK
jgi:hypothetical protein